MRFDLVVHLLGLAFAASSAMAMRGDPPLDERANVLAHLVEQCADRKLGDRERAFLALHATATTDDLPWLAAALHEAPRVRSRTRVARVMGLLDDPGARVPLEHALERDESEHARAAAARSLADLTDRRATPALAAALRNDPATRVRKQSAATLGRLGGPDARRALEASLVTEKAWDVRRAIEWVLADGGPAGSRPARIVPGTVTDGVHRGTRYQLYVPSKRDERAPRRVLVMIHGTDGHPQGYMELAKADAERHGLIVVAPWFDWPTFPNYGMLGPSFGAVRPDMRLLEIIDALAERTPIDDRVIIFGHSQGGAFVQRFMLAHGDRVARGVVSAANGFASPDVVDVFPYGVGENPLMSDLVEPDFASFLRLPTMIVVGAEDAERFVQRARAFIETCRTWEHANQVSGAVSYLELPGVGHSASATYEAARDHLFGAVPDP